MISQPLSMKKQVMKHFHNTVWIQSYNHGGKKTKVDLASSDKELVNYRFKFFAGFLHSYIVVVEDVVGDGNCGFWCVAEQVKELNFHWIEAKKAFLEELNKH